MKRLAEEKDAQKEICKYYDYLITCNNNASSRDEWVKALTHPRRNSFESAAQNPETHYIDLVNLFQKHSRCNSVCCLKEDNKG